MRYYYIIIKLRERDEISKEYKEYKLFNDYQKKEEMINKLRQQYLYTEGEKYTFFPIINNYIFKFKYKNPYIINNISSQNSQLNNKVAITEPNKFLVNKKNEKDNNILKQKRYNKNKIIKRIKIMDNINTTNKINYKKINKSSSPNLIIKNKTEVNINKLKGRNMTLKSLIQEEKLKDKIINKKLNHNMSNKNVNKMINEIFNKTNIKRNKTEANFITNDDPYILTDKTYNYNSTYDNMNLQLKRINLKNYLQKNNNTNNFLINNKSSLNIPKNKIIFKDINKSRNEQNKKIILHKKMLNNYNKYNKTTENIDNKIPKKIIKIFPYHKLKIKNIKQISNNRNNNNRYYNKTNFNKTQINNDETTLTSDYNELKGNKEIIYKNISFEIKNKKENELYNTNKKDDNDDVSIQSLSDSKVFEIANTYIDEKIDKNQINGILTHKKLQNQNYSNEK